MVELLVTLGCYLYSARKVDNTGYSYLISYAHNLKNYILIAMNVVIGVYCSRWRTMASRETILFYLSRSIVSFLRGCNRFNSSSLVNFYLNFSLSCTNRTSHTFLFSYYRIVIRVSFRIPIAWIFILSLNQNLT